MLTDLIETVTSNLPLHHAYSNILPTNEIKAAVADIYIEIVELLGYTVNYYHTSRFGSFICNKSNFDWQTAYHKAR